MGVVRLTFGLREASEAVTLAPRDHPEFRDRFDKLGVKANVFVVCAAQGVHPKSVSEPLGHTKELLKWRRG